MSRLKVLKELQFTAGKGAKLVFLSLKLIPDFIYSTFIIITRLRSTSCTGRCCVISLPIESYIYRIGCPLSNWPKLSLDHLRLRSHLDRSKCVKNNQNFFPGSEVFHYYAIGSGVNQNECGKGRNFIVLMEMNGEGNLS